MDNDVSQVINRTALIENLLNQVVEKYASPRKEVSEFFWNIYLDSSIMPLGSKVKIAVAISQQLNFKLERDSLHRVLSYRNAFAHHALDSHPVIAVGRSREDDELYYVLQTISNSGKTKRERREDALQKFNEHYMLARTSLVALLQAIRRQGD